VAGKLLYPGFLEFGSVSKYLEISSGLSDIELNTSFYGEPGNQILKISKYSIESGKKYTLYLHRNDETELLDAHILADNLLPPTKEVKVRFVNLYRNKPSGYSTLQIYAANSPAGNCREDKNQIVIPGSEKVNYGQATPYFNIDSAEYVFIFGPVATEDRSANCKYFDLSKSGTYSIVIGSWSTDGGSTVIAVAD
jgi:hypothetical protein